MLNNGEDLVSYNDFSEVPYIPYKILEELLTDNSKEVNNLWKLLKYSTTDALSKADLTEDEKSDMIWKGDSSEEDYSIFLKPLISSSLGTAESQTQMRLFRYNTAPITRLESVIAFEIDFTTNEKTNLIYSNGMLCERTDFMVNTFLQIFNGRDIGVGILQYNKELSRSCQDLMGINNSKSIYGRSLIMALDYIRPKVGDICG